MSLKQQLFEDMKAAMKSGDKHSLGVIRLINAAIKQREVDERIELTDADVIAVLDKMVKQRKDSVTQFEAANREDLAVIRLINAAIKQKEVDERIELDDAAVIAVLDKMVKQRKDSISQYDAANRGDLADIERAEMAVIETYLPAKMDEAAIVAAIEAAKAQTGATSPADIGKLMGVLKPMLAGQADMGLVSRLVKAALAG